MPRYISLAALPVVLAAALAVAKDQPAAKPPAAGQPGAKEAEVAELVDSVIKAHGGEAALGKVVAFEMVVKGTNLEEDGQVPISYHMICQGMDKQRAITFDTETNTQIVEVDDGSKAWTKVGDDPAETLSDDDTLKVTRENGYLNWITTVFPLKKKEFRLEPLEETSVAGRPAVGLLIQHEKHDPVKLYFDKETHLLVKLEHTTWDFSKGANVTETMVCSNYKTVQGIKQPFKVVTYEDGKINSDVEIVELKVHDKPLDDKLFIKP